MKWCAGLAISLCLIGPTPVFAHHSFTAAWNVDQTVTIEGIVLQVRIVNPHAELKIDVTDANGQKSIWTVTSKVSGTGMLRAGWTERTLPIGSKVKVEGSPSRDKGARALAAGKITKADGSVVWLGGC